MSALRRIGPILVLVALPFLASWPAFVGFSANPIDLTSGLLIGGHPGLVPGTNTIDLNAGVTTQALGRLAATQWLHGIVPWWNSFSGIGMPLAGEMQSSALFLPFILLMQFDDGTLLLKLAMQVTGGLACFALLRSLGLSVLGGAMGAALFGLSGTFAWLGHAPILPVPFLPLFFLGIEHARRGGYRTIAVAVAFSLYAGFPETAFIDGLLALLWGGWRLGTQGDRARFGSRVALGGVLGLMLAAPVLWGFVHFLLNGSVVNHVQPLISMGALPPATPDGTAAVWLFPYLYGPLFGFSDPAGALGDMSQYLGGYLGVLPLLLALSGLGGKRLRGLRWALLGWIVLFAGGVGGLPVVTNALYALPMMRAAIVARYAVPSCQLAVVVLAALAFEDWRRGAMTRGARIGAMLAMVLLAGACLWPARRMIAVLASANAGYAAWPVASLLGAMLCLAGMAALLARPATPRRALAMVVLVLAEAAALFMIPLLAGTRDAVIDTRAVAFLHDHAGLQRFYALGPYRPNYGAYFETAQINHEYLPLPANWIEHVRTALDPSASVIMFRGDEPPLPPDQPSHARQMVRRLASYEALGVRYVVTPVGNDPFASAFSSDARATPGAVRALAAGDAVTGTTVVPPDVSAPIEAMGLVIGTYLGQSDGRLSAELCNATECARGDIALAGAADNAMVRIALEPPLSVQAGETLRWRVRHEEGRHPVAIWQMEGVPRITFSLHAFASPPSRVYRDALMDIYELPNAAAYFEARGGPCRLVVRDREALEADCDAPALLIRRELFFSGWQAWLGNRPARIAPFDDLMQQVTLPAGRTQVRFAYAPPHMGLCWALMAVGALGLLSFRRRWAFAGRSRSA